MGCLTDPVGCGINLLGSGASDLASSAWDSICQSFATAATKLLTGFANHFVSIPNVDVASGGVKNVYAISLGLATFVSALLLFYQVIRTAMTRSGAPLAHGLVGVGKAALAFAVTLTVVGTALAASDGIARYIVDESFGGTAQFSQKVANLVKWDPSLSGSLLLIFAIIAILLIAVLWIEMLFRNAAVAILVATSPIAASGQISEATQSWWSRGAASTLQLIILKPIVALVFALGFSLAGDSQDIETTLSGMLVLLLAVVAWPAIARFFSFATVQAGGGMGLGAVLGFAGGRLSAAAGGPNGTPPEQFGQEAAGRTMANFATKTATSSGGGAAAGAGATSEAGPAAAASSTAGGSAAASAGAAAAGPLGIAIAGIAMAQKAANAMSNSMERMAGHAGMGGNPYVQPAGQPAQGPYSPTAGDGNGAVTSTTRKQSDGWPGSSESPDPAEPSTMVSGPATQELPVTSPDTEPPAVETEPGTPTADPQVIDHDPYVEPGEDE
jgi:hypothetical protein